MRREDAALLAARHDLPALAIAELVDHRLRFDDGERGRDSARRRCGFLA